MTLRAWAAAAGVAIALAIPAAPAFAQYVTPTTSPKVGSTVDSPPKAKPSSTVKGTVTKKGELSVTGADVAMLAALGLGTAGVGAVLVAGTRQRRAVKK